MEFKVTEGGGSVVANRVSREDYRNLTADQLRGKGCITWPDWGGGGEGDKIKYFCTSKIL